MRSSGGDPIGKLAVVGQEQQSFSVEIQTADRVHSRWTSPNQLGNKRPSSRVRMGAQIPSRLVQEQIGPPSGRTNAFPVDSNMVMGGIHFLTQPRDRLAVYGNPSLLDQTLGLAPGTNAGVGNDFLQPVRHHGYESPAAGTRSEFPAPPGFCSAIDIFRGSAAL